MESRDRVDQVNGAMTNEADRTMIFESSAFEEVLTSEEYASSLLSELTKINANNEHKLYTMEAANENLLIHINALEESNAILSSTKVQLEKEAVAIRDNYEKQLAIKEEEIEELRKSVSHYIKANEDTEKMITQLEATQSDVAYELEKAKEKCVLLEQDIKEHKRNEVAIYTELMEVQSLSQAEIQHNARLSTRVKELQELVDYRNDDIVKLKEEIDIQREELIAKDNELRQMKYLLESGGNESCRSRGSSMEKAESGDLEAIDISLCDESVMETTIMPLHATENGQSKKDRRKPMKVSQQEVTKKSLWDEIQVATVTDDQSGQPEKDVSLEKPVEEEPVRFSEFAIAIPTTPVQRFLVKNLQETGTNVDQAANAISGIMRLLITLITIIFFIVGLRTTSAFGLWSGSELLFKFVERHIERTNYNPPQ